MDGNVEEILGQQPHTESNGGIESNLLKDDVDGVLSPQAPDQTVEYAQNTESVQDDTDSEPPCMTPVTTSSEDANERNIDTESTTDSMINDQQATDVSSVVGDQSSAQVPIGKSTCSGKESQDPDDTSATAPDLQSEAPADSCESETKDIKSTEAESQHVDDGEDEDQTKPSTVDDDSSPSKEETEQNQSQDEKKNEDDNKDDNESVNKDSDDGNEDENKDENSDENEDESNSSPEDGGEVDPANISLPASPYFNPFENNTSSRRGSIDDIPLLDDTTAHDEPVVESSARRDWTVQKEKLDEKNDALDKLMGMVGLESAKMAFLEIKSIIDASRSRRGHLKRQDLNLVLTGNPGTGKRTLANLYFEFLRACDVWGQYSSSPVFVEKSGHTLHKRSAISDLKDIVGKGVIYISDAEFIDSDCRAYLMDQLKGISDKMVIILSGSFNQIPTILGSSSVARWLFPRQLHLEDYKDDELRRIFVQMVAQHSFKIDQGPLGPCPRIVAKRAGRSREEIGFGNIHELRLAYGKILERHSIRIRQRMSEIEDSWIEQAPDENLLTFEDIIGPEPEDIRTKSEAWKELQKMAGLEDIKAAVNQLLSRAKINYQREICGKKLLKTSLNRLFIGPPGTGKTTVAKLYGQILADIGLVSSQKVIYKTPGDFIGQYIGESETKTSAILDSSKGKVLIIDDAHMFYHDNDVGSGDTDEFRLACIDIIVSKIHNRPGEDRCVILVGYPERMEGMLQKCNPGLRRRFPLEEAFRFPDYDDNRLTEILNIKMEEDEIKATPAAMEVASEMLRRARDRPNFGNGGEVVNFLSQAKTRHRERLSKITDVETMDTVLEPQDFDSDYNRGATAAERCRALFDGLIGFEDTIRRFQTYQRIAENLRLNNKDPRSIIPFTYIFKGPPGTGKTHTARIIGQIFYDMGFLSTNEVIECSATHLIGKYIGHTGPKVVEIFERSLGKVLFIDEAYRLGLGGQGNFTHEAVGEIVDCMTKPRYYRKMVIVMAGYTHDMDLLMKVNAGLRGRFATEIMFTPMSMKSALQHLRNLIAKQDIELLEAEHSSESETIMDLLSKLAKTKGWSNGRDMQTLAGVVTEYVYGNMNSFGQGQGKGLCITREDLIRLMREMLQQRMKGEIQEVD
ncbi:P-loop containing nucleoside triphosphate hydrolase protein [Trichoderma barbatum]